MTRRLNLLYVDDDPDIRTIVELALGLDPGIDVRAVASGPAAKALLTGSPWRPDIIVLDVMMPDMSGPETLSMLRRLPTSATTPVIFMTAKGRDADLRRYIELGAAGVILKPFDPLQLAAQVRAYARPE